MTNKYIKTNINYFVKVKLTDYGINILNRRHGELNEHIEARGGEGLGDLDLNIDKDGYYTTQMHNLFYQFDGYIGTNLPLPFETEILIQEEENND